MNNKKYLTFLSFFLMHIKAPFPQMAYNQFINQVGEVLQATFGGYYDEDSYFHRDPGNLESTTRDLFIEFGDELNQNALKQELLELFDSQLSNDEIDKIWELFYKDASQIPRTMSEKTLNKKNTEKSKALNQARNKQERNSRITNILYKIKNSNNEEEIKKLTEELNKVRVIATKTLTTLTQKKQDFINNKENRILINAINIRLEQIKSQIKAEEDTEKRLRQQLCIPN